MSIVKMHKKLFSICATFFQKSIDFRFYKSYNLLVRLIQTYKNNYYKGGTWYEYNYKFNR